MDLQENQVQILEIPKCVSLPDHQFRYFHSFREFHVVARMEFIEMGSILFYAKIFLHMLMSQFTNFTDLPLLFPGIDVGFCLFFWSL